MATQHKVRVCVYLKWQFGKFPSGYSDFIETLKVKIDTIQKIPAVVFIHLRKRTLPAVAQQAILAFPDISHANAKTNAAGKARSDLHGCGSKHSCRLVAEPSRQICVVTVFLIGSDKGQTKKKKSIGALIMLASPKSACFSSTMAGWGGRVYRRHWGGVRQGHRREWSSPRQPAGGSLRPQTSRQQPLYSEFPPCSWRQKTKPSEISDVFEWVLGFFLT